MGSPRTAIATAPGRVNLIGEHTDHAGGLCLPFALPQRTIAWATRRDDDVVVLRSRELGGWTGTLAACGPGGPTGWARYAAGVLWALTETGVEVPGLDVGVSSTVPIGAGLSSSAALEAAVAVAVCGLLGLELDAARRRELVAVCRRAETEVAGAPTGGLDQCAALLSRPGHALLIDFAHPDDPRCEPVPLVLPDDVGLLVVDTRVQHAHGTGGYGDRAAECREAAAALGLPLLGRAGTADVGRLDGTLHRRARHVVTENQRVRDTVTALRADRTAAPWDAVGALMTASHRSLRDDFEVSCPELDLVVDTALTSGALGARMTGGGFGGSAVVLAPTARVPALRRAVDAAFADAGLTAPGHLDVSPSGPATVLETR